MMEQLRGPAFLREEPRMPASNGDLSVLYQDTIFQAFLYSHASTGSSDPAVPKTAMLRLASFMHTDAYQYQRSLIAAMKAVALAAPERFIVDVRGNGGGVVVRGYELVKYLVPNMFPLSGESVPSYACDACVNVVLAAAEPKYVVNVDVDVEQRPVHHLIDPACPIDQYDVRHNDVLDVFWSSFGGTMQADWISHKGYTDWYYPGKNRTFTNMSGAKFNHLFSSNFTLLSDLSFLEANPSPITFDPQHFAVLTDGLCGSTCAAFSKRLHEAHAAKMIGVGGVWVNGTAPTAPFDIASFAGGSVIDSQLIDQIRDQVKAQAPQYTASELPLIPARGLVSPPHVSLAHPPGTSAPRPQLHVVPPQLPRNGYLRFAFYDLYAWDWTVRQKGIPLEFLVNPADWVIPTWPAANDLTLNLLTSVFKLSAPYFDKCASWEVKYDAACTPIANGRAGRPCDAATGTFDTTRCAFLDCLAGYYKNADGACVEVPSTPVSSGLPWWAYLIIGLVVFAIVCAVVAVIICCCCCRGRGQNKSSGGVTLGLPPSSPTTNPVYAAAA
ncbi:hypothetical protein PAPYR_5995 [Paratrimastix pyriformis]|uniref:Tail specific protease domain-containing protein n=1 Tax=Paratrimastix pyriformis TaxID=342808 RepID=A0ABQ8UJB3_9EUKA|nr:hypothetical protein PAPYR_5995 [Paratrimastix pyriformis]